MFASQILCYLGGNVLIPEDEKIFRCWYTVAHCFYPFYYFLQQNYDLQLGFKFNLSKDQVLYSLAPQRFTEITDLICIDFSSDMVANQKQQTEI